MKPMLAATIESLNDLAFPLYGSPKLDGIRALVINGVLMSRNLKPIPNLYIQRTLPLNRMNGWDGELIVGKPEHKDCFRTTTSGIMSEDGEPKFTFYVFDNILPTIPFKERLKGLMPNVKNLYDPRIKLVPQVKIDDAFALHTYEGIMLERGYEGVMLRSINGAYKFGRSTLKEGHLMKLKKFADSEAKIVGFDERMHNANEKTIDALGNAKRSSHKENKHGTNTLGALRVVDCVSGVSFDVGTGFDDSLRAKIWSNRKVYLNQIIKYKYFPMGSKDKPRFPVFVGFRKD